jgi:hypothetical protein
VKGTVQLMGRVGTINACLALLTGRACYRHTGSMLLAIVELYITALIGLAIAYHVGLRFAAR